MLNSKVGVGEGFVGGFELGIEGGEFGIFGDEFLSLGLDDFVGFCEGLIDGL